MMKSILLLILFLGFCITINAQQQENKEDRDNRNSSESSSETLLTEKSRKEQSGDKSFFIYDFDKAIKVYVRAKKLTLSGQRNLAESYMNIGDHLKAEEIYSELINNQSNAHPEDYYNYASILKYQGKYTQAFEIMDEFSALSPMDLRAKDYLANKHKFENLSTNDGTFKMNHLNMNSNADDYAASYFRDKIVYVSNKPVFYKLIKRNFNWTGKPFWNMYVSAVEDGELKNPNSFNRGIRSKFHDGPVCFSKDGTFMAFTRNTIHDKSEDNVVELQIFFSSFADDEWTEAVPFKLNDKGYSVGHPSLTPDGNTMYFASNMPGGFGGSDLYVVTKSANGDWGPAVNLGANINTEGDELFPFFESINQILFFSSDGRFGLGGLDVFYSAEHDSDFGSVKNAGYPLNTQYDDFAVIVNSQLDNGYISSNRTEGSGADDIYSFQLLKNLKLDKRIQGVAMDIDGNPVPKTMVSLLDNNDQVIDSVTTGDYGVFDFFANADTDFMLTAERENYEDGSKAVNTFSKNRIVKADIILRDVKTESPESAEDAEDDGKVDMVKSGDLNTIYFDFDKYNIRADAQIELNKIVSMMNKNPNLVVEIQSHTDSRGTESYNMKLSDRRALATLNYIKSKIENPERIYGKGYGQTSLVNNCTRQGDRASNCSEEQHQANRRTEFFIVK
ncbi:MAG: OmpA family protein [Bacteroidota bacterium]